VVKLRQLVVDTINGYEPLPTNWVFMNDEEKNEWLDEHGADTNNVELFIQEVAWASQRKMVNGTGKIGWGWCKAPILILRLKPKSGGVNLNETTGTRRTVVLDKPQRQCC
jgi:hypothetical protein